MNFTAEETGKLVSVIGFLIGAYADNPGMVGAAVMAYIVCWWTL